MAHRGRVVSAKLFTYAVAGLLYATTCTVAVPAAALLWLAARTSGSSSLAPTSRARCWVVVEVALYAVLGVAVGCLVLLAWALAFAAVGTRVAVRRDIT